MEFFENIYFNIIDVFVIIIVLTSSIVAAFRGLVKEAFSIISWIFALAVALNFFKKFKLELIDHISNEILVDFIAFSFPFLATLFFAHIISNWLSPKFSISELLIFDKILGFVFGIARGILLVVLLYLGFLYLIGKDKALPNLLLEANTFKYIKSTADIVIESFVDEKKNIKEDFEQKEMTINN